MAVIQMVNAGIALTLVEIMSHSCAMLSIRSGKTRIAITFEQPPNIHICFTVLTVLTALFASYTCDSKSSVNM